MWICLLNLYYYYDDDEIHRSSKLLLKECVENFKLLRLFEVKMMDRFFAPLMTNLMAMISQSHNHAQ